MRLQIRFSVWWTLAMLMMSACAPGVSSTPTSSIATATIPPTATTGPTATAQVTAIPMITLKFWLPDTLAGLESVDAGDILSEQISSFEAAYPNTQIDLRLRTARGTGGILETIRSAYAVAPSAMPDITLMQYNDFRLAVQSDLIVQLNARQLTDLTALYHPNVLQLGFVEEQLYGLPASLDLLHTLYIGSESPVERWTFDTLLDASMPMLFPAASSGISDVFLLQYLVAGASRVSEDTLMLDEAALRTTLRYYERALEAGLIAQNVLEFDSPERYSEALPSETAIIVNPHVALNAQSAFESISFGPVPTNVGTNVTLLDGWVWVITARESNRQQAALRFLAWMLSPGRQGEYYSAIQMLPATGAAQRQVSEGYATFIESLLTNAQVPPAEYRVGNTARALQSAYTGVISGQNTTESALSSVLSQFGS